MLSEGDKAPDFELETDSGKRVSLASFKNKTLVLYFYPKDSTPGCTREAQAFTAARKSIEAAGGAVLGVSRDSVKSHCSFRDEYELAIPLASDPDLSVHKAYGAWGEKTMYGKKVTGVIRSTFLVKDGRIARVFSNVKVDGHADAVLRALGDVDAAVSSRRPTSSRTALRAREVAGAVKTAAKKIAKKVGARAKKKTTSNRT